MAQTPTTTVTVGKLGDSSQETSRATEDIAAQVETIQGDPTQAVAAISEISSVIG